MSHFIIGRDPNIADIVIKSGSVSRQHAKFHVLANGKLALEDMGSTGGTFIERKGMWAQLNGPVEIRQSDRLKLASHTLSAAQLFQYAGHKAPANPMPQAAPVHKPAPPRQSSDAPDIFLSYAREDLERIKPLVAYFEQQGWTVFWDRKLGPGQNWNNVLEKKLLSARAVVVAWSNTSVNSQWVKAEAMEAYKRQVIVPILLDNSDIPLPFGLIQTADLSSGSATRPRQEVMSRLVTAIGELIRKPPAYADAPLAAMSGNGSGSRLTSWKHILFGLSGRINGKQYGIGFVLLFAALVMLFALFGQNTGFDTSDPLEIYSDPMIGVLVPFFFFALYVIGALIHKRLHDIGTSGKWTIPILILGLVTVYIPFVILGLTNGMPHGNEYGPPPA